MIFIVIGKILLGVLMIPACVVATRVFGTQIFPVMKTEVWFFVGLFSYLFLLGIFQQPIRTYIFGHEMTHVLWVWIFGGRVKGFKAAASGGEVSASKTNFLIFLAPYFFPLYTALLIASYFLLTLIIQPPPIVLSILSILLGFTWAFHFTFTIYVLIQGQPDIWATGRIFSFPVIYLFNIIVLAVLIIFVSPSVSYAKYFSCLWREIRTDYRYLWNEGPGICRDNYYGCKEAITELLGQDD